MAIGDGDVGTRVVLAEGPDVLWLTAEATSAQAHEWRMLYEEEHARAERERARAEAAEARAEELRWAEVSARCGAGYWKSLFEASRRRLRAVVEETREACRAAKDPLRLRSEVERLHDLLRQAGVESSKRSAAMALRVEVARLGKAVQAAQRRIGKLEAQLSKLRATRTVLSKKLFGRKSEKQETPRSGRRRGRQPGAPGRDRTQRPGLAEHTEEHDPPTDARVCSGCGSPYAANGAEQSTRGEIEVQADKRVIHRPRWRRTCGCASSPGEVSGAPRATAVRPHAVRDERLVTLPVRARPSSAASEYGGSG